MTPQRKTYEDSCAVLTTKGLLEATVPPMRDRMPSYDDEEPLGVSFFRTQVEGEDLSRLSLPRSFFGRSLISKSRWTGSDLSESRMCWNDFEDCDFEGALLVGSDLRASNFDRCSFAGADLSGADLRRSNFEECSFAGANVSGVRLTEEQVQGLGLDARQRTSVSIEDEGEEPGGG